jgi:uncharacterized membrane protein YgcG
MAAAVLAPLALGACDQIAANEAMNKWHPAGVNAANLAAMVKDPADLARGRTDPGPDRKLSAHAVTSLWANPTSGLPGLGANSGGASAGSGGAGAGTGGGTGGGSGGGGGGGSASAGSGN